MRCTAHNIRRLGRLLRVGGPLQHREFADGGYCFITMGKQNTPQSSRHSSRPLLFRLGAAFLAFCVGLFVSVALTGGVAAAQGDPCQAGLVDASGQIDAGDVEAAIADFAAVAPDTVVYARVFNDNTDLDDARQEILDRCGTSANYLYVAIDTRSQQSSVLSSDFANQIGSDIRTGAMSERLRGGDLTGGIVAAINDATDIKEISSDTLEIERDEVPVSEPESTSSTGSLVLAGTVVGLAGAGGGVMLRNRRKQLNERRDTFNTKVSEPRIRMGAARERDARLSEQGERFGHTVDGRTLDELRHLQHQVGTSGNDAERGASLLTKATPGGIDSASNEELQLGETRLAEFGESLDRYQLALDALTAFGELLDRLRVALPTKQSLLLEELDDADDLAGRRTRSGWKIDEAVADLATARTTVSGISFDELKLDLLEMSDQLEEAEALLFAARHEAEVVVDRPKGLHDWAFEVEVAEREERTRIAKTEEKFAQVIVPHSPESWRWATEHTDNATKRLDRADIRRAQGLDLVPAQDWKGAANELENAGLELNAADELLDELDTLVIDLEQARIESPSLMKAAVQELDQLQRFVASKATDLAPKYHLNPQKVQSVLEEMARELTDRRPNYLRVARTLDRIDRQMDQMLIESQEEAARVDALRRQLSREVARADRAIQRAQQTLGWTIFSSRKGRLDSLSDQLGSLSGSWEDKIVMAGRIADTAVSIREEIIHERRRRNTGLIIVGGSGGRSRGGWGSSGGGGGFGGFSGGGGGFGGGSFGGGSFGGGGGSFGGGGSTGGW